MKVVKAMPAEDWEETLNLRRLRAVAAPEEPFSLRGLDGQLSEVLLPLGSAQWMSACRPKRTVAWVDAILANDSNIEISRFHAFGHKRTLPYLPESCHSLPDTLVQIPSQAPSVLPLLYCQQVFHPPASHE